MTADYAHNADNFPNLAAFIRDIRAIRGQKFPRPIPAHLETPTARLRDGKRTSLHYNFLAIATGD